jgi:hypothetical protein
MQSKTILYDKRREPCYASIPVVQYIHMSSAVSACVGPNVLLGQLHRFSRIVTDRANPIQEAALCVHQPRERGFLFTKLLQVSCSVSCGAIGTCVLTAVVMLCIVPSRRCV